MVEIFTLLFFGICGLYLGAELLIFGGASFAYRLGIPLVVIGLVVVGYGTGTPELIVTLQASFEGRGDIAIGNVIGSNIANIALILGLVSLIRPVKAVERLIKYDALIMVWVSLLFSSLLLFGGSIGFLKGGVLLLALVAYTIWALQHGKESPEGEVKPMKTKSAFIDLILIIAGFAVLFIGGRLFLSGSTTLAKLFGISDAVIGLTVVAFGTSLPELATCLIAGARKREEIVLGNIIGSCIFNILAIIGVAALIAPITFNEIHWVDYVSMSALAITLTLIIKRKPIITRLNGLFFLLFYIAYTSLKYTQ